MKIFKLCFSDKPNTEISNQIMVFVKKDISKNGKFKIFIQDHKFDIDFEEMILLNCGNRDNFLSLIMLFVGQKIYDTYQEEFIILHEFILNEELLTSYIKKENSLGNSFISNELFTNYPKTDISMCGYLFNNPKVIEIILRNLKLSFKKNLNKNISEILMKQFVINNFKMIAVDYVSPGSYIRGMEVKSKPFDYSSLFTYGFLTANGVSSIVSFEDKNLKFMTHHLQKMVNNIELCDFLQYNKTKNLIFQNYLSTHGEEISIRSFRYWQNQSSTDYPELTTIMAIIYMLRPDLQIEFKYGSIDFKESVENWFYKYGVIEYSLEGLVEDRSYDYGNNLEQEENSIEINGINIIGNINRSQSLAVHSNLVINFLEKEKVPINIVDDPYSLSIYKSNAEIKSRGRIFSTSLLIVNANHLRQLSKSIDPHYFSATKKIGWWTWETNVFPTEFLKGLELVDEIWVVSKYVKDNLSKYTKKEIKICHIPLKLNSNSVSEAKNSESVYGHKEYFFFAFDFLSGFERKNPEGLISAFKKAFENNQGPNLVIKINNQDKFPKLFELLLESISTRSDIIIDTNYYEESKMKTIIQECLAVVSLHRSEGFGLLLAEAMALGKPVIATAYSGNLDFMNENNSILIPYKLISVEDCMVPEYSLENSVWAEPDLILAAKSLSLIWENIELRKSIGDNALKSISTVLNIDPLIELSQIVNSKAKNQSKLHGLLIKLKAKFSLNLIFKP
jgi:glycosyltransferase involved in cell wall biosynthesis